MSINKSNTISLILLAAGESSRLGTPKQLLLYKDKYLLQHTLDLLHNLNMQMFVVVGAFSEQILGKVDTYNAIVVQNRDWNKGLASSIRAGLEHVLKSNPDTEAVILLLCDQPLLTSNILLNILEKYKDTSFPIIHSNYGEVSGPPTLFHRSLFPYLMELEGAQGAKKVVDLFPDQVALVDFFYGTSDIDTPDDYQQLLNIP